MASAAFVAAFAVVAFVGLPFAAVEAGLRPAVEWLAVAFVAAGPVVAPAVLPVAWMAAVAEPDMEEVPAPSFRRPSSFPSNLPLIEKVNSSPYLLPPGIFPT